MECTAKYCGSTVFAYFSIKDKVERPPWRQIAPRPGPCSSLQDNCTHAFSSPYRELVRRFNKGQMPAPTWQNDDSRGTAQMRASSRHRTVVHISAPLTRRPGPQLLLRASKDVAGSHPYPVKDRSGIVRMGPIPQTSRKHTFKHMRPYQCHRHNSEHCNGGSYHPVWNPLWKILPHR